MSVNLKVSESLPGDVEDGATDDGERSVRPRYEVNRNDDGGVIRIDVPGATEESTQVSAEGGVLTVRADRRDAVGEGLRPILTGIDRAGYRLRLELGADFDTTAVRATLEHGILSVHVPLSDAAKS